MTKDRFGFEDVYDKQKGIFGAETIDGSSAMDQYANAKSTPTEQGLLVQFTCEGCGKNINCVVTYPELFAIKHGVPAQNVYQGTQLAPNCAWGYDQNNNGWFPDLRDSCNWPLRPIISAVEANNAINAGTQRGWLNLGAAQQLNARCAQMRASMGGG